MKLSTYLIAVTIWGLFIFIFVRLVLSAGPLVEEAWFPVLKNVATSSDRSGDKVTFTITIDKLRGCKVDHFGYQAEANIRGTILRTTLDVKNAVKSVISISQAPAATIYPTGMAMLGPFFATLPDGYDGTVRIWGDVWYSCHPFWLVHAIFGPVVFSPVTE